MSGTSEAPAPVAVPRIDADDLVARALAALDDFDAPPTADSFPAEVDKVQVTSLDLETDHVNDPELDGATTQHSVSVAPPLAASVERTVELNIVQDVPLCRPIGATSYDIREPIMTLVSASDTAFTNFNTVLRSSQQEIRGMGDFSATVGTLAGREGIDNTDATISAMTSRIAAARIAVLKGATASAHPAQSALEVITCALGNMRVVYHANTEFLPIFIPSFLAASEAAALVSLLVRGGPSAYTWRYRPLAAGAVGAAAAGDANYMPAVVRKLFPGGFNKILVVFEEGTQAFVNQTFGGGSFTEAALSGLERKYRAHWNNGVFDIGWRTAMALSGVYLKPEVVDNANFALGAGFELRQMSTTHNGVNLDGDAFRDWSPDGRVPAPNADQNLPIQGNLLANDRRWREIRDIAWNALGAARNQPDGVIDRVDVEVGGLHFYTHNLPVDGRQDDQLFAWGAVNAAMALNAGNARAILDLRSFRCLRLGITAQEADNIEGDEIPGLMPEDSPFRNVYGAKDHMQVRLPRFDLLGLRGLFAGAVKPTTLNAKSKQVIDRASAEVRTKLYGAHLHLANFFSLANMDVWPADLAFSPVAHARVLMPLAKVMKPLYLMDFVELDSYDGQNYWVFESSFVLRNITATSRFGGFAVPGDWDVNINGLINLNKASTSYGAIEAAVRGDISDGGTVDAHFSAPMAGVPFAVIIGRGRATYVHPLPFTRRVGGVRGSYTVHLISRNGRNSLSAGHTQPNYVVRSR